MTTFFTIKDGQGTVLARGSCDEVDTFRRDLVIGFDLVNMQGRVTHAMQNTGFDVANRDTFIIEFVPGTKGR